jgi:hypothetical protein
LSFKANSIEFFRRIYVVPDENQGAPSWSYSLLTAIRPETCNRVVILKSSIYHACKHIRKMSNTLQSGNIVKFESTAEVFAI